MIQVRSLRAGPNLRQWDGVGRRRRPRLVQLGAVTAPPSSGAPLPACWAPWELSPSPPGQAGPGPNPAAGLRACSRCPQQRERGQGRFTLLSLSHHLSVSVSYSGTDGVGRNGERSQVAVRTDPPSLFTAPVPRGRAALLGLTPSLGAGWSSGCLSLQQGRHRWGWLYHLPSSDLGSVHLFGGQFPI